LKHHLRGVIARRKKLSIITGSVIGLVAAAGISYAIAIGGGVISGHVDSLGGQPNATWAFGQVAFEGCTDNSGQLDDTAYGSATVPETKGISPNPMVITLTNVFAGEVCTFGGLVDDAGSNTPITVTGVTVTATDASGTQTDLGATLADGPVSVPADPSATGSGTPVTFSFVVPSGPGRYTLSGALDTTITPGGPLQYNPTPAPTPTTPVGWNLGQQQQP
jgi:hypothetical protein